MECFGFDKPVGNGYIYWAETGFRQSCLTIERERITPTYLADVAKRARPIKYLRSLYLTSSVSFHITADATIQLIIVNPGGGEPIEDRSGYWGMDWNPAGSVIFLILLHIWH